MAYELGHCLLSNTQLLSNLPQFRSQTTMVRPRVSRQSSQSSALSNEVRGLPDHWFALPLTLVASVGPLLPLFLIQNFRAFSAMYFARVPAFSSISSFWAGARSLAYSVKTFTKSNIVALSRKDVSNTLPDMSPPKYFGIKPMTSASCARFILPFSPSEASFG